MVTSKKISRRISREEAIRALSIYAEETGFGRYDYESLNTTIRFFLDKAEDEGVKPSDYTNLIFDSLPYVIAKNEGRYHDCVDLGINLLQNLQLIDSDTLDRVHKGTPYYWIAISAYKCHDFDTAVFFFNLAAQEDKNDEGKISLNGRDGIVQAPPAILFMLLEERNEKQAAGNLTKDAVRKFKYLITKYNRLCNAEFHLHELRTFLLYPAILEEDDIKLQPIAISLISFIIEYGFRAFSFSLDSTAEYSSRTIYFLHLIKGCIILESLLRNNPYFLSHSNKGATLSEQINHFKKELQLPDMQFNNVYSMKTLLEKLDEEKPTEIWHCFEYTLKIRNSLAHNLVSERSITKDECHILVECVTNACFHTIVCLYQPKDKE